LNGAKIRNVWEICCPEAEGALLPVPEGRGDRSLARSAWDSPPQKEPSRRVRWDSRRYVDRFDDWSDYPFLRTGRTFRRESPLGLGLRPIIPCPTGRFPWVGCSRHFVPGYDRPVPPGLVPLRRGIKAPNISGTTTASVIRRRSQRCYTSLRLGALALVGMLMSLRFIAQWICRLSKRAAPHPSSQHFTQLERLQGTAPLGIKVYTGNWQCLTVLRGNADQESSDVCRFYSSPRAIPEDRFGSEPEPP
jgi:hypothetical protein